MDDARKFGSLDNVSAFPFENFMKSLKSSVRKPQQILQQLANRMAEGYFTRDNTADIFRGVKREHTSGSTVAGLLRYRQYKELHLNDYIINLNAGDNCIMYGSKIGLVSNIFADGHTVKLIIQQFEKMKRFFSKPLTSSDLSIFVVSKVSKHFEICSSSAIQSKYVILPLNDNGKWIAIPLNHSFK